MLPSACVSRTTTRNCFQLSGCSSLKSSGMSEPIPKIIMNTVRWAAFNRMSRNLYVPSHAPKPFDA